MDSTDGSSLSEVKIGKSNPVDNTPPQTVETFGRYDLKNEIGRGGMGVVYRALDLELNRHIAIKVLREEYKGLPEAIQQFSNEAAIMGRLQHPGIAHIYQCGVTDDERPFHAMKLVNGETLGYILANRDEKRDSRVSILGIFAAVAQAMAYTHAKEIVHLDLKPANVMAGAFGEVHVMDWGLARCLDVESTQKNLNHYSLENTTVFEDESNHVHGTLRYMAPEQARADTVDKRTDVFCLGSILCEILTGKPPYVGKDRFRVLMQAQCGILAPAMKRLDGCGADPNLIRLAKKCMKSTPDERPQDASYVASEMAAYSDSVQQRLQQDMARFFELSLDLFCIAGFDGFFRRVNENFTRVLGYTEEELLTKPFADLVYEKDRSRTIDAMGRLFKGEPVVHFRNRYVAADGKLVQLEWSAKSIVNESVIFAVARVVI
ncbi:MAG: protein kinase [Pirellulaceae bacterium]|nr:protein kinase [Pirellulaceae bacterium]